CARDFSYFYDDGYFPIGYDYW
nr:immunoglobulin heavy chain junction region [Macaca mulatta]MOW46341.1 immunoglobulin heavy chain junction region [Macaca mulatta]MOW46725.1 immunoglobulin heavy chain junction region [Macaca mulatta]MOW46938.1 immunoglobulin heavy chain junction region [Macaca mulatta]MOW47006.1 immunoglobulin heavy chain junction region [Macaca mulatta]